MAMAGTVLWLFFPNWFRVNIPFGSKDSPTASQLSDRIRLPDGFAISVYASDLPGARILRFTEYGDLLVTLPRSGLVVLLKRDDDRNGLPDKRKTLLTELNKPHGIDIHDGWLYVAETHAIGRILFDAKTGKTQGDYQRIVTNLPPGGNHWSRTLRIGPDGLLYVSVGSSCNVCEEKDPRRAAILRFRPDGTHNEIYAAGLRNTVGFDWRPGTDDLYGVDNGRDLLGDDFPPCELNRIERGKFYGWPYANGKRVADPDFGEGNSDIILASAAPEHEFGAHTAPLGITFLNGNNLPLSYRRAALVTLHGSWNRSKKVGYKVVSLHFNDQEPVEERPFLTGFEVNDNVIGRPADVIQGPDGNIYVSDDYSGSVYRVVYSDSNGNMASVPTGRPG